MRSRRGNYQRAGKQRQGIFMDAQARGCVFACTVFTFLNVCINFRRDDRRVTLLERGGQRPL